MRTATARPAPWAPPGRATATRGGGAPRARAPGRRAPPARPPAPRPPNSDRVMGVAFDATILSFRADRPGTCAQVGPEEGCEFFDAEIVRGREAGGAAGARVGAGRT